MLVNLKSLIGRVNPTTRTVLESAVGLCVARTHYDVEVEHFLVKLLDQADSDFDRIARHFGLDQARLSSEVARSLDRLKTGNSRTPAINSLLTDALAKGWTYGSLEMSATLIRSGFVVFALIADEELSRVVFEFSKEMRKIEPEALRRGFAEIVAGSAEVEPVTPPAMDRMPRKFRAALIYSCHTGETTGHFTPIFCSPSSAPRCRTCACSAIPIPSSPAWSFPRRSKRPWRRATFCSR